MVTEDLITACKKMHRDSQRQVYELLAPTLYRTCRRYLKKEEEAEEALADAFFTIFTKLDQLKEFKAFEGWARKIAVNHCLLAIRRNVNFNMYLDDVRQISQPLADDLTILEEADLLKLLQLIPEGCKTVFNLFVIEGYAHREIAQMLSISEGTSKSQLNAAKSKLKQLVSNLYYQQVK